jgi:predicted nucleic acid-binding protein
MKTSLDTCILSALWSNEPSATTIAIKLGEARQRGAIVLCPISYAELFAHPRMTEADIVSRLEALGIRVEYGLSEEVWKEAGRRYAVYANRRRKSSGETPRRLMADFVIGAHALLQADRLMTLDIARFVRDFPELALFPVHA